MSDDARVGRAYELDQSDTPIARRLRALSAEEARQGAPMFLGKPDRWYAAGLWRCENNHVSGRYLKTDAGAKCLAGGCRSFVWLTFPEDKEGPLL